MGKRDDNSIPSLKAINPSGNVVDVAIDPVTGYLLAYITVVSSLPVVPSSYVPCDDSNVRPLHAVDGNIIRPLTIDQSNGGIIATFS